MCLLAQCSTAALTAPPSGSTVPSKLISHRWPLCSGPSLCLTKSCLLHLSVIYGKKSKALHAPAYKPIRLNLVPPRSQILYDAKPVVTRIEVGKGKVTVWEALCTFCGVVPADNYFFLPWRGVLDSLFHTVILFFLSSVREVYVMLLRRPEVHEDILDARRPTLKHVPCVAAV